MYTNLIIPLIVRNVLLWCLQQFVKLNMIIIGTIRLAPNVQDLFLPLPANFIAEIVKGANLLFQGKIKI
jgi:hypothetical protein